MENANPKIALINVTKIDYGYLEPPLGLLSIASYLIREKVVREKDIKILDVNFKNPLAFLKYFKPNIVGLSAMTASYPDAITLGRKIKNKFETLVVIGGIHISVDPQNITYPFDIGVIGEGEETFLKLVKLIKKNKYNYFHKLRRIKGIVYLNENNKPHITPRRLQIKRLDKLPMLNWSLLPKIYFRNEIVRINNKWCVLKEAPLFSSRGCPFNCVFCARKSLFKGVRYFSIKRIVDEIEILVKKHKVEAIHFWDDIFSVSKKRTKDLIKEMEKRNLLRDVVFNKLFARADLIDEEFLSLLKKLEVVNLSYGFESGSDKIIAFLKNDTVTVADNRKAILLTDKFNIGITGSFMFGSPHETKKDMEKTLDLIKWAIKKENFIRLDICKTTPYPGTKIWQYALDNKIISKNMNLKKLKLNVPSLDSSKPIFVESEKIKDFKKIWSEVKKLYRDVNKKNDKQGYHKAWIIADQKKETSIKFLPFELIWNELRVGRFYIGINLIFTKTKSLFKIIFKKILNKISLSNGNH